MKKPRLLSLCSGIGAIDLAAQVAGIEIAGQVEINPFCQAVLRKNFGDIPRKADMKEVQGDEFGTVDIVAGGIPCQPFSKAGKRKSTADDRYLWPEMHRIVKNAQPTWVLIENVDDFARLALDIVQTDLETSGYAVQAFVLPACAVGAPHIRERCFVVAYSGGNRRGQRAYEYQFGTECKTQTHTGYDGAQRVVAYSGGQRCQERDASTSIRALGFDTRCVETHRVSGEPQPRLGRGTHGVASWMDRHIWPALPGYPQYAQEPPRTVSKRQKGQRQRLEALGNAVVWQQVYPIFDAIMQCYVDEDLTV